MTLPLTGANVIIGNRLYHVTDGTNRPGGFFTAESFERPSANYQWTDDCRIATPEAVELWTELIRAVRAFRVTDTHEDMLDAMTAQRRWNLYLHRIREEA